MTTHDRPPASVDPDAPRPDRPPCQNCGAPLLGDHCYACGQPVKGLVRHFSSIVGDFLDSVFNIDTRIVRTLGPLFARPGFLSLEYFAGHRVRYVSPVRLFFFLSIVTFFVAQLTLDFRDGRVRVDGKGNDGIASATTVEEVERQRDEALKRIAEGRAKAKDSPGAAGIHIGMNAAEQAVRETAEQRIAALREAKARGEPPPPPEGDGISFGSTRWDPVKNPIRIDWLPGFANDWLNAQTGRANDNIARMKEDPNLFKDAVLGAVPSTLFVLLPVFALMLKLAYAFKRRLYMEHLVVALHSHAFLCLALLMVMGTLSLQRWLAPQPGALQSLFGLVEGLLFAWMPLYLLLMQKRVYGQGWLMTLLKYFVLGVSYSVLLGFGAAATVVIGLVWM